MKKQLKVLIGWVTYLGKISFGIIDLILSFIIMFTLGWIEKFIFRDYIHFIVDEDNIFKISIIRRGRIFSGRK